MKKCRGRSLLAVFTALLALCYFGASLFTAEKESVAKAEETQPDIIISDDFSSKGLADSKAYEYENFATDENGDETYGIVPAASWGKYVAPGDAYITYKIETAGDSILSNLNLSFTGYYGCADLPDYWGENKTNVRILYSKDNASWTEMFNLHSSNPNANGNVIVTSRVINPNGQSYNGAPVEVDQENIFGNHSLTQEYNADLSSVVGVSSVFYIKIQVQHLTFDELAAGHGGKEGLAAWLGGTCDAETETLALSRLGVYFNNIKITADEIIPNEEDFVIYREDMSLDFSTMINDDLSSVAYEIGGLSIRQEVDYKINGENVKVSVLAPASKNSEGFITFKFSAPDGRNFSGATLTSLARCFDYNMQGNYEKIEYYVSYNNATFELVHSALITNVGGNCPTEVLDLERFVFGKKSFYVKVLIGCSGDTSWTNLKELSLDVEFEKVNVTVDYGNGYRETVTQYRGECFDLNNISVPDKFIRKDDNLYTSIDMSEDTILDLTAPITDDITVYVNGEWNWYSLAYELDGGSWEEGVTAPDKYTSSIGVTLPAPVKEGYLFVGWFTDSERTQPILEIPAGQTGNYTLYAKWVADTPVDISVSETGEQSGCGSSIMSSLWTVCMVLTAVGAVAISRKSKRKE